MATCTRWRLAADTDADEDVAAAAAAADADADDDAVCTGGGRSCTAAASGGSVCDYKDVSKREVRLLLQRTSNKSFKFPIFQL
jgi:hypothetical protein